MQEICTYHQDLQNHKLTNRSLDLDMIKNYIIEKIMKNS